MAFSSLYLVGFSGNTKPEASFAGRFRKVSQCLNQVCVCLDNLCLPKDEAIATELPILYQWPRRDSIPALLRCEMLCLLAFSDPASKGLLTD